ncbi:MAG: hypothetical protein IJ791_09650 [Lachnospiraceae bacterium]|nr:hypothetical protein [Lachnospiraceae bacterium]
MSENFLDVFIIICGVYLVFSAIKMNQTRVISTTLISKGADLDTAFDKEGFIKAMYRKTVVLGTMTAIVGILDIVNTQYLLIPYFNMAMCLAFFIIVMLYAKMNMDAQKKYLWPNS